LLLLLIAFFGCSPFKINSYIFQDDFDKDKKQVLYTVYVSINFNKNGNPDILQQRVWDKRKTSLNYSQAKICEELWIELAKKEIKIWRKNYKEQRQ